MLKEPELTKYHNPQEEEGYWTKHDLAPHALVLNDGRRLEGVTPLAIEEQDGSLAMKFSSPNGELMLIDINQIPGLQVVKGDSQANPHEKDGELLIEIRYLKIDNLENKPRRIRPTGVKVGIMGDTNKESLAKGGHRAMGESADYYLVGHDTQYDPGENGNKDMRHFPFWRLGVYGNQEEMAKQFLPAEQGETKENLSSSEKSFK